MDRLSIDDEGVAGDLRRWLRRYDERGVREQKIIVDVAALLLHRLRKVTRRGRTDVTRCSAVPLKLVMKVRERTVEAQTPHQVGVAVLLKAALMLDGALDEDRKGIIAENADPFCKETIREAKPQSKLFSKMPTHKVPILEHECFQ
eukprot:6458908-Amphidinium_carterae.1